MVFNLGSIIERIAIYFSLENIKRKVIVGLVFAALFIILNLLVPSITIGFPDLPQATQGERFGTIVFLAPFGEEFAFSGVLQPALDAILPAPIAIFLKSAFFSIFHARTWAGSFSLQGIQAASAAFFGAFVYSVISSILIWWQKSVYTGIASHLPINLFLWSRFAIESGLIIIGGG